MNKTINDMVRDVEEGEGESATKYLCSSCGWEIITSQWWWIAQTHSGDYLCDDCEMTLIVNEGEGV
jgi:predicted RNA-binding Zn-ribbon protein involved in translation (DUF1610 family)